MIFEHFRKKIKNMIILILRKFILKFFFKFPSLGIIFFPCKSKLLLMDCPMCVSSCLFTLTLSLSFFAPLAYALGIRSIYLYTRRALPSPSGYYTKCCTPCAGTALSLCVCCVCLHFAPPLHLTQC